MVANDPSREMRVRYFRSPSHPGPRDLDSNLLNTQHTDLKSCTKLTAKYRSSGWEPRSTNTITTKTTYWKLKPRLGTRSQHKGTEQDLNTKERSSTCTTKHTIGQQLRVPQLANHNLQKWYKMKELLKRSPTLPHTYQTTAGNYGNCRRKATVNSNLGFEAKNTIEKYFAKYGIWCSKSKTKSSLNTSRKSWLETSTD
ncbi:ENHANCER OF AG-4 protein 2 [Dorcoceras hygrometricum]|uniref:ENHANCER OF AG-4 protein 2 n=1 Tax=Dorcoceras hygrometricum TaxID=472368 RepID=A0A2Z7CWP7_9LAMI|nr:ENHANCER OF AG-4 protein 2 [Dorcoceras hygrometricum]